MEGIREIFAGEAEEILQNLEPDIVSLEEGNDPEVINRIFRAVHTLKGSSSMAGFMDVSEFTHKLENLMDAVRGGKLQIKNTLIDILLGSMDWVKCTIFGVDESVDMESIRIKLLNDMTVYMSEIPSAEKKQSKTKSDKTKKDKTLTVNTEKAEGYRFFRIRATFSKNIFESGIDPLIIMEDLILLGRLSERKVDRSSLPSFEEMDPEKCYLGWDVIIRTKEPKEKIEDVFLFVNDENNEILIDDITTDYKVDDTLEPYKLGEIMLSKNIITEDELTKALDLQESDGKKIAEIIIEKGFASDEDVKQALDEQDKIKKKIESSSVRVATGKLDTLLNLLGEIVIGQSAISRVAEDIGGVEGERVKNAVYGLDRTTREFQEQIMAIRMIPVGPTFEQFKRFIRDTAKEYGKEIRLEIEGAETELDKTVIEKINDPLKHMIRNCIDHGIESPEHRNEYGKDTKGMIKLKSYHQEGSVYIEVADDGRGIDREKVRRKAEQLGLIKPSDEITDEKLLSLLFLPGFSTAEKIGSLSGRGVGMDVVKTNIDELRGTIKINTEIGKGTTFVIKLPLTLAIIDGMLVRVGNYTYIIPLLSIVESIRPDKTSVKTIEGQGEVVFVRGQYVTLLKIFDLFGVKPEFSNPWESLVVVVESNGTFLGLMVDELIGQQQIVIKSMDAGVSRSRAISGASILGDGTVSLIIDVHGLIGEIAA